MTPDSLILKNSWERTCRYPLMHTHAIHQGNMISVSSLACGWSLLCAVWHFNSQRLFSSHPSRSITITYPPCIRPLPPLPLSPSASVPFNVLCAQRVGGLESHRINLQHQNTHTHIHTSNKLGHGTAASILKSLPPTARQSSKNGGLKVRRAPDRYIWQTHACTRGTDRERLITCDRPAAIFMSYFWGTRGESKVGGLKIPLFAVTL